jgi:hypothetical protein
MAIKPTVEARIDMCRVPRRPTVNSLMERVSEIETLDKLAESRRRSARAPKADISASCLQEVQQLVMSGAVNYVVLPRCLILRDIA